ncbi:MAG: AAA family ATPase [Candidatus Thorarchaeota archaeon]
MNGELPEVKETTTIEDSDSYKKVSTDDKSPNIAKHRHIVQPFYKKIALSKNVADGCEIYTALNKKQLLNENLDIKNLSHEQSFVYNIKDINTHKFIQEVLNSFGNLILINRDEILIEKDGISYLFRHMNPDETTKIFLNIYTNSVENIYKGDKVFREYIKNLLKTETPRCNLKWWFIDGTQVKRYSTEEELNDTFFYESYPYIDGENLIKEYLKSDEPILVLIGPPGTGKTKLIRQILKESYNQKGEKIYCYFTSSEKIIEEGSIYIDFLFSHENFLILEDIDFHLKSRSSGNHSLYSLLSVSNGVMCNRMKNKKIILTTNLPNVRDLDEALIRPGRCFDVVNTRKLSKEEALNISKIIGKKELPKQKDYSLAEIYN